MEECVLIIPTHSSYRDVCLNFIELLKKNWSGCKYKLVISVCGNNIVFENTITLYAGVNATLVDCIRKAKEKFSSRIYFVFLGDAFIYKSVNEKKIELIISELLNNNIQYCRLYPQIMKSKKIKQGVYFRKLNSNDRYGHSFIAFACTPQYIENELLPGITDYQYELKYLQEASECGNPFYYPDHVMLLKNSFHIFPGIEKGKWDRIALGLLKLYNRDIHFSDREKISFIWQIYLVFRRLFVIAVPEKLRSTFKGKIKNKSFFSTKK